MFGFTQSELERQKLDYLVIKENEYRERAKTESATYVAGYLNHFLEGDPIEGIEHEYELAKKLIPAITVDDVNSVVKNTISTNNRVVIITGPEKESGLYPNEVEIIEILNESNRESITPYVDSLSSEPLVGELPDQAKISESSINKRFGITNWALSNGINIWLKPTDFKADEIILRGFSPGGTSALPDERIVAGIHASAIANSSGVKDLSESKIVKKLAGKFANASTSISGLYESVSGSSTPNDLESMLQLLYLRITNVNFNQSAFESYVSKDKAYYENVKSDPDAFFNHTILEIAAKNHPRFVSPYDLTQYDKLTLNDVKKVYEDRFSDFSDANFVLVGNFRPEKIKPLLLKYLGNLPVTGRKDSWRDVDHRGVKGPFKKIVRKGIEQKSRIEISFTKDVPYDNHDRYIVYVMGQLLKIKLMEVLREEKSGVYGVNTSASISEIPYSRFGLSISFSCSPDNVETLSKAATAEVDKIIKGEIDQKDIEKFQQTNLVSVREAAKRNANWANRISVSLQFGRKILSQKEIEDRIRSVTKAEIQRVAKKYIELGKAVEFVLMPERSKRKSKKSAVGSW
jgi:zinc protease